VGFGSPPTLQRNRTGLFNLLPRHLRPPEPTQLAQRQRVQQDRAWHHESRGQHTRISSRADARIRNDQLERAGRDDCAESDRDGESATPKIFQAIAALFVEPLAVIQLNDCLAWNELALWVHYPLFAGQRILQLQSSLP